MTATAPTPAAPEMAQAPEPASAHSGTDDPAAAASGPAPRAQRPERSHRDGALTNTILSILGAAFVAVLSFALIGTNSRISRLGDKMDAGFARVDDRFADQDEKIDTIDLKLTALIAALNKTDEVGAAIDGRVVEPSPQPSASNRSATRGRRR